MPEDRSTIAAVFAVIDEVRATFHVLKAVAEQVHGEGEPSAARRGVLLDLDTHGPRTVPRIARSRPVSRQHIQVVVNGLLDDGYVELAPNPAHKRSHLVRLTAAGQQYVRRLKLREAAVVGELEIDLDGNELRMVSRALAALRHGFEGLLREH